MDEGVRFDDASNLCIYRKVENDAEDWNLRVILVTAPVSEEKMVMGTLRDA